MKKSQTMLGSITGNLAVAHGTSHLRDQGSRFSTLQENDEVATSDNHFVDKNYECNTSDPIGKSIKKGEVSPRRIIKK